MPAVSFCVFSITAVPGVNYCRAHSEAILLQLCCIKQMSCKLQKHMNIKVWTWSFESENYAAVRCIWILFSLMLLQIRQGIWNITMLILHNYFERHRWVYFLKQKKGAASCMQISSRSLHSLNYQFMCRKIESWSPFWE